MRPISKLAVIILILMPRFVQAQSFVSITNNIDNFTTIANNDNAVYPYDAACNQKQISKSFLSEAALGGAREVHFNGFAAGCSDNKATVVDNALNINFNDAGTQMITTNLIYDGNTSGTSFLNTRGLNLDLSSNRMTNVNFSLDFSNINSANDIYIKLVLYSADNACSEVPVKLSGNNFNTTVVFSLDSLRRNNGMPYAVNLSSVGAIRIMIKTKGNTTMAVKNFNMTSLQNRALVNTVLQNTQYLNQVSLSWINKLNDNTIASQSVEASVDGINFVAINNATTNAFMYADKFQTYTTYRIKTVDNYNRVTYSNIITATKISFAEDIKVFPTVASTSTTLFINSSEDKSVALQLLNANGQIFLSKTLKLSKGINTFVVPISSATSGILWISTVDLKNNNKASFKIIKQ
jgi:hypothetical protein